MINYPHLLLYIFGLLVVVVGVGVLRGRAFHPILYLFMYGWKNCRNSFIIKNLVMTSNQDNGSRLILFLFAFDFYNHPLKKTNNKGLD